MKRTILIPVILLGLGHLPEAVGQNTDTVIPGVSVENSNMNREGKYLAVEINLDINKLDVDANRAVLLTPRLVNGTDSLDLPSVGIYGRRRYYYYVRNGMAVSRGKMKRFIARRANRTVWHTIALRSTKTGWTGQRLNSTAAIGGVVTRYWRNTKAYWGVIEKLSSRN